MQLYLYKTTDALEYTTELDTQHKWTLCNSAFSICNKLGMYLYVMLLYIYNYDQIFSLIN